MTILRMNRRHFLGLSGSATIAAFLPPSAIADISTGKALHGLSAFGDLKYGPDFQHFDYASPEAPKGGTFNFAPSTWVWNQNTDTFNTLNTFTFKGDAPPRMELTFDTLMASALDEPDSVYGLIAESATLSKDRRTARSSFARKRVSTTAPRLRRRTWCSPTQPSGRRATRSCASRWPAWKRWKPPASTRFACVSLRAAAPTPFSMP